MTASIVNCQQITKRYGDKHALDELNVSIPENKIVGILGPNGSGKSTFFRMITGLVKPDSGEIEVLGKRPGSGINREIAYLPDRARWYPNHTVAGAFEWAEKLLPGFDIANAKELADFMEMKRDMRVSGMSRGQEARLMLILCMARNVPLIILDEPFSGIDVISRERIIEGMIDYLSDRDQTILISTHEIYEVEGMFDYAIFLNQGKAILSGDTEELRAQYGSMHDIFRQFYRYGKGGF
ncbi:ABC-2 type transport system ATP-binding protein [Scopulibacillus daqui]|uniref:ABC-2 type transport system ATP-binding protein n=1 Tax=Scopulibacillus daqui TaxID=1469162 RepID=A0ABS2PXM7_9BACL|nr:ABC transporter ATP-binding protein [Scopulibacillus daqui]MBM7644631.1 ABC-2 type transport system ATP-binding protein [Scopulibacillus daqui]